MKNIDITTALHDRGGQIVYVDTLKQSFSGTFTGSLYGFANGTFTGTFTGSASGTLIGDARLRVLNSSGSATISGTFFMSRNYSGNWKCNDNPDLL